MTNLDRKLAARAYISLVKDGMIKKRAIKAAGELFRVGRSSIYRYCIRFRIKIPK